MAHTRGCAVRATLMAALLLLPASFSFVHGQATDTSKLDKLSGAYASSEEPDVPVSVYPRGGKLVIESENAVPMELSPVSDIEFAFPGPHATVRFSLDETGQAKSLTFSTDAETVIRALDPPFIIRFTITSARKQ